MAAPNYPRNGIGRSRLNHRKQTAAKICTSGQRRLKLPRNDQTHFKTNLTAHFINFIKNNWANQRWSTPLVSVSWIIWCCQLANQLHCLHLHINPCWHGTPLVSVITEGYRLRITHVYGIGIREINVYTSLSANCIEVSLLGYILFLYLSPCKGAWL